MVSTTEEHSADPNKNLQKLYSFYVAVGFIVCGILVVLWLLALFSIIDLETDTGAVVSFALFVIFVPPSIFIRSRNKNRSLKAPGFVSADRLKFLSRAALVFFIVVFASGIFAYPYAPIKQEGAVFTDKAGQKYSYMEYITFKKWELSLAFSWSVALLQVAISMPILYEQSKRWWKL